MKPITRKEKLIAGEELTPITREEMFLKQYGCGASSWNDLTDKPFGIETTEGVITFDGDYSKYEHIEDNGSYLVHVSDKVLLVDDLVGARVGYVLYGDRGRAGDYILRESDVHSVVDNGITGASVVATQVLFERSSGATFWVSSAIISVGGDLSIIHSMGLPFTKEGTYFYIKTNPDDGYYVESVSCLTGLVETTKTLDEKFLPESVDGVVIRSSTVDSTKKFKLTVDDSGTIAATEVTE